MVRFKPLFTKLQQKPIKDLCKVDFRMKFTLFFNVQKRAILNLTTELTVDKRKALGMGDGTGLSYCNE